MKRYVYTYITRTGRGCHFTNTTNRQRVHAEIREWLNNQHFMTGTRCALVRVYARRTNRRS
jgi:hypothetical protein